MSSGLSSVAQDGAITRREFEVVIRRAAELYASEAGAEERISEAELMRIAAELGLPEAHVRRALFELPGRVQPTWLDHVCGTALVAVDRVVPGEAGAVAERIDAYLTTREFLRLRGRRAGRAWYAPGQDAITREARAAARGGARSYTARARQTLVGIHAVEPDRTRVRVELDLAEQRGRVFADGVMSGGVLGALAGAGLAIATGAAATELAGQAAGILAGALAFGGTTTAGLAAGFALAKRGVRRRLGRARAELEGLLDRLSRGDDPGLTLAPGRDG
ncbi:MAG TPA: hypothetical protein VF158_10640 [Longimicrobiales bacterium]